MILLAKEGWNILPASIQLQGFLKFQRAHVLELTLPLLLSHCTEEESKPPVANGWQSGNFW